MSAVGERGQVTIPKAIRDQFGLTKGVEVEFEVLRDGVKVTKRSGKQSAFARYEGYLADRWVIGDIDQYLRESRGR